MRTESASPLETPAMSSLCESECGEGSSIGDVTTSSMGTGESEEETRPLLPGQGSLERIDTPNLEKVKVRPVVDTVVMLEGSNLDMICRARGLNKSSGFCPSICAPLFF